MELSKSVKDFVVEFRAENKGDSPRQPIRCTEDAARQIREAWVKKRPIDLTDENGNYKETLETRLIRGIKKDGGEDEDAILYLVCDYGTRHPHRGRQGFEDCKCSERFNGLLECTFRNILEERYPKVQYSVDITPEMQREMEVICKTIDSRSSYIPKSRREKQDGFEPIKNVVDRIIPKND